MAVNTKNRIADALVELIEEKPLAKITINDIVSRAKVGRRTFYNHFCDKNDLISWFFLRTLPGKSGSSGKRDLLAYTTDMYCEARKYSHFFRQACKLDGQNSLFQTVYVQTYEFYKKYIVERHGKSVLTPQLEYALRFNAYGASNLYVQWAEANMPGSAEEQAQLVLRCIPQDIRKYLPAAETTCSCPPGSRA